MLKAQPMSLKKANEYVAEMHRHHPPVYRDMFRVGCYDTSQGRLVGVVQVGRPVARGLDDGKTVEVVRLCSDGTKNVCSFLYGKASRIAKELGYSRIVTYILDSESGDSLKASGWAYDHKVYGRSWSCPSRPRQTQSPTCDKQMWVKILKENENGKN